eukprot:2094332-Amphidinium_carterae.1
MLLIKAAKGKRMQYSRYQELQHGTSKSMIPQLIDKCALVSDVDVLKEELKDVGAMELVVLDVEVEQDVLIFEGVLVDVDVVLVGVVYDALVAKSPGWMLVVDDEKRKSRSGCT